MKIITFNWPDSVPFDVQVEHIFIQGMLNRTATSFFKYGPFRTSSSDGLKNALERIRLYKKTGNTEGLIDAANYLMKEFMSPRHKKAHFRSTPSSESPGRILKNGMRTHGKD